MICRGLFEGVHQKPVDGSFAVAKSLLMSLQFLIYGMGVQFVLQVVEVAG